MDNTPTITPVRTETIQCPECNTIQDATVDYENAIAMSFWRGYAVGFLWNEMGGQS